MFLKRAISNSNKSRQENKYAADIITWGTICPRCNIYSGDRSPTLTVALVSTIITSVCAFFFLFTYK